VIRMLISLAIHLAANALGLIVAALVLDDMSIDAAAFILALIIFTVVEVVVEPLLQKMAVRNAQALQGATALFATFIGLLITDIVSDGLSIEGAWTWVLATVIVWLGAMLAAFILPLIFVRNRVEERRN
jgi:putative membrane protein